MERTACCHCGSLRAKVSGEPVIVNVCTARLASGGPAQSCTPAYISKNLRFALKVLKKSIPEMSKAHSGRSAFIFAPLAAVRSTGMPIFDLTILASPLAHLRTLIFRCRRYQCGNKANILGSFCRKACSTFPRGAVSPLFLVAVVRVRLAKRRHQVRKRSILLKKAAVATQRYQ